MKLKIILTIFLPMMLTLFVLIFLPSALLLFANPNQQQLYISNQIKTHEISFRNVVYQNQKIIQKLIQNCEDIKNTLFTIYINNSTLQQTTSNLTINNASNITKESDESMYYTQQNNSQIQSIMDSYLKVQMFNRALLPQNPFILSMSWTFQQNILFVFPSTVNSIPGNYFMFDQNYNTTMNNYKDFGSFYTTFQNGQNFQICTIMLNKTNSFGVICMEINGSKLFNPQYTVTSKQMTYLILATTIESSNQYPQVVFTSNISVGVTFPQQPQTILQIDPQINQQALQKLRPYWYFNSSYNFYSYGFLQQIWYQFPIFLYNYQGQKQNVFFLFSESIIDAQLYSISVGKSYLIEVTVIPIVLFMITVLISYLILNKIINNVVCQIDLLVKKSQSLLDDDLEIKIPEYQETYEVRRVYSQFEKFAQVTKYSDKDFFSGNHTEKTIKYYKALKLYSEYKNNIVVGNIYQNLANLSNEQDNLIQAANYYRLSLESIEDVIVNEFVKQTQCNTVKALYQFLIFHSKRIPTHAKHLQTTLIRRYYNYIETSFRILSKSSFSNEDQFNDLFKRLQQFQIILKQKKGDPVEVFVNTMLAKIHIVREVYSQAEARLLKAEDLYRQYQIKYQNQKDLNKIPPQILYQHLSYSWGRYSEQQNKPLQAFQYYIAAFDGETYDPLVRQKLLIALKRLLVTQGFNNKLIRQSVYFQPKFNQSKQYVIVIDFSLSMATKIKIKDKIMSRTQLAISESLRIFDEHIKPKDRLSILKFQSGIQQIFNLTQKCKYQRMLKGTIQQLRESQVKHGTALYNTLKSVFLNVKGLKKEKIIIFIIDGIDNCSNIKLNDLEEIMKSIQMTLLFITIDIQQSQLQQLYELRNFCHTCYFISIYAQDDINRILKGKSYQKHYPEIYIS